MFSSEKTEWETPQDFFDELDDLFHFTLDACALPENAKCKNYYTPEQNGLRQSWHGTVWCNPPYGRQIGDWVKKGYTSAVVNNAVVVMLLPARTDTAWFHDFCYMNRFSTIRFLRGRLKFGGATNSAPFPSMVVIFRRPIRVPVSRGEDET